MNHEARDKIIRCFSQALGDGTGVPVVLAHLSDEGLAEVAFDVLDPSRPLLHIADDDPGDFDVLESLLLLDVRPETTERLIDLVERVLDGMDDADNFAERLNTIRKFSRTLGIVPTDGREVWKVDDR